MDALMMLWEFAPELKAKLLYLALIGQIVITIYCYSAMSKARVAAVRGNRVQPDNYKATTDEPEDLRVYTRAVANQFEMLVVFYVLVLAALMATTASWITVALAWIYVILRGIHAREMIGDNTVLKRRKIFIQSARIILLMVVEFVIALLVIA
ncbi:MAG: MAPEG family protein [Hyphomicrobiales bacterium]|nr:MAPEG family protein [Hyphomicrobiales bacterium]